MGPLPMVETAPLEDPELELPDCEAEPEVEIEAGICPSPKLPPHLCKVRPKTKR